jgi:hypothetical protein
LSLVVAVAPDRVLVAATVACSAAMVDKVVVVVAPGVWSMGVAARAL